MGKKLISILTATRNCEKLLPKTLANIYSQKGNNWEHVVKDGESTDGTLNIIEAYRNRIAYFESSKDAGIYDALNQAAHHATGEWAIVIHAGDELISDDILQKVTPFLSEDTDIAYGDVISWRNGKDHLFHSIPPRFLERKIIGSHQAMFIRTSLLKKIPYDQTYRIAADYDFLWKAYQMGARFKQIPFVVARIDSSGISSANILKNRREKMKIANFYSNSKVWRAIRVFDYSILLIKQIVKRLLFTSR